MRAKDKLIDIHVTQKGIPTSITGDVLVGQDTDLSIRTKIFSKNDILIGSVNNDLILGGEGNDRLDGGLGDDVLIGGNGLDTYVVDGNDRIIDSDGQGIVLDKNGNSIIGAFIQQADGTYVFLADNSISATKNSPLTLNLADGSTVVIEDHANNGDFGITLVNNTPSDVPTYIDPPILGDLEPDDIDPDIDGIQIGFDSLGNVIVGTEEAPGREDTLFGSTDNDLIQSLGGNDTVDGKAGDDRIEGGSGQDQIDGGLGNDVLLGEAGSDIISGHENDDRLYAETEYTIEQAYNTGETQAASGENGSLLDGGTGDDRLFGDSGEDIQMGGMGQDIIMGLGGDDTIEGDWNVESANLNWEVTRNVNTNGNQVTYSRTYNFTRTETLGGDNDVIYGGAGDDWIFAQGGNDFIDGGADNDVMFGEAGNDTIWGQSGNDELNGDSGSLDIALHGDDYLNGGDGEDRLAGGGGSDLLDGGADNDILAGEAGNDTLFGGTGADQLQGGAGNDVLDGGAGADILRGGAGNDTYVDVDENDDLYDLEGINTIQYSDASGVATNTPSPATWSNTTSTLSISLDNDTTLDLIDALYGMDANIQFADGNAIDLQSWVSENLNESVRLFMNSVATSTGQSVTNAYGGKTADFIEGSIGNDTINGHGGNDNLLGRTGDDSIIGGAGNDILTGGDGIDTLHGGLGADRMTGGSGADIYIFDLGDGADIITSANTEDAAGDETHLGDGIIANDLRFFELKDNSLLMRIVNTQDSILFKGWFTEGANITALRLADDTLISASEMSALASDVYGGTDGDDVLIGTNADDRIEAYAGDDILDGGIGNDVLVGGDGTDTYLFGWDSIGDDVIEETATGNSIISLAGDMTLNDLRHTQTGNDLVLSSRGGAGTLTLLDYYVSSHNWSIQDGTNMTVNVDDWLLLPPPPVDIAQLQSDFLNAAKSQWATDLLNRTDDANFGQYERIDDATYRAQLVTEFETKTTTQQFSLVDSSSDETTINRQFESHESTSTGVNVVEGTPSPVSSVEQYFYSSELLHLIPPRPGQDVTNWEAVFNTQGEVIGFMVSIPTPPPAPQSYFLETTTTDTQIENIQAGASDNIIEGYKNGNVGGDFATSNFIDDEISIIDGGDGNDIIHASGRIKLNNEEYYFTDTAPRIGGFIYGNSGDDTLYGNHYRDTLVGGDGNDFLDGGFSQDTYYQLSGELGTDTIWDTGTQLYQLGGGLGEAEESLLFLQGPPPQEPIAQDTLNLEGINQGDFSFIWGQRAVEGIREYSQGAPEFVEVRYTQTMHATLTMTWTGGGVEIVLPNSTDLPGMGLERIQFGGGTVLTMAELIAQAGPAPTLNPQELDNVIVGQDTNDVIFGESGNDTLDGGGGDDFLNGGTGNDLLTGGAGNDTYFFGIGSGQDIINSYDTTIGKADTAEFDYGVTSDGVHVGRSGNDLVLSIIGTSDTLIIENYLENDGVTPYSVERIRFNEDDIVWDLATIQAILDSNRAPELSVALQDQEATEGNTFSYIIDANTFTDPDAGDMLTYSSALADGTPLPSWLSFDAEALIFDGTPDVSGLFSVRVTATDSGNLTVSDIFDINVSVQSLTLEGTSGADTLDGGIGDDILRGLGGDDILNGNAGNDRLNGGAGNDTMAGGTGDDIYVVNSAQDVVIENLDEGFDTVRSSISYVLGENLEKLNLDGTDAIDGTGNALDNNLVGNSADNILTGAAGNDRLNGDEGADTMIGGSGDDVYIVDNANDTVIELSDEGIDKVRSSISYTLSENIESLVLIDDAAIDGTGNDLDNKLIGNIAVNILTGGAGNDLLNGQEGTDTMIGGIGDDIYVVDDAGDIVVELGDEGIDKFRSSISYTLSENVEKLVLIDSIAINGTGNALDNSLVGNDAGNILTGELGDDRLNGKEGADTLIGGGGNDVYILGRGYDNDTVIENDSTAGNNDVARFLSDISANQIWFQHVGNSLEVSIIGTIDKLIINDWYSGAANRVEEFRTVDGLTLQDSQVQSLVDAMAGFAIPDIGQTDLPVDYAATLDPIIASLWV